MNKVELVGRLAKDVDTRYTQGENATAIARFSVAINRRFKNAEGSYEADFINCLAFGKTAEFITKYFKKGSMIGLTGRIQTGSYTNKEGNKVYTTEVVAEEVEFVESKSNNSETGTPVSNPSANNSVPSGRLTENTDSDDEALPF